MDLARLIAEELGIESEILHMDFDAVIGAVASGVLILQLQVNCIMTRKVCRFSKSYFTHLKL